MNELEIEALQSPISNLAKVLYCVYLRPQASVSKPYATVNNKDIVKLLNSHKQEINKGREVNRLFEELNTSGLIETPSNCDLSKSLHKQKIQLPLIALPKSLEDPALHAQHKAMHLRWRPAQSIFEDLCALVGVIEATYSADELGEFIAYWLGRVDTHCTEYTWTQKLVIHLKQRRQRLPLAQQKTATGHQYVEPSAGIVFDENVKNLIDKYKDEI